MVMTYKEGGPPETGADSRRVADAPCQLQRLTQGWPQRADPAVTPESCQQFHGSLPGLLEGFNYPVSLPGPKNTHRSEATAPLSVR